MKHNKKTKKGKWGCILRGAIIVTISFATLFTTLFALNTYMKKQIMQAVKEIPNTPLSKEDFEKFYPHSEKNEEYLALFFSPSNIFPVFKYKDRYGVSCSYFIEGLSYDFYDEFVAQKIEEYYFHPENIVRADTIEKIIDLSDFRLDFQGSKDKTKLYEYVKFLVPFRIYPAIRAGETGKALELFIETERIIDIAKGTPLFITYLNAQRAEMLRLRSFTYLLSYGNLSEEQLIMMDSYFARRENYFDSYLPEVLSNETGCLYINYLEVKSVYPETIVSKIDFGNFFNLFVLNDILFYFKTVKSIYPHISEPTYIFDKKFGANHLDYPIVSIISDSLISAFCIKTNRNNSEYKSLNRATRVAIAIERFRLKYGENPSNLFMLIPEFLNELPIDLITGNSFEYIQGDLRFNTKFYCQKKEDSSFEIFEKNDESYYPGYIISNNARDESIFVKIIHALPVLSKNSSDGKVVNDDKMPDENK